MNGIVSRNGEPGISGGDIRMFEILRHANEWDAELFTSAAGRELCRRLNVRARVRVFPYAAEFASPILENALRIVRSCLSLPKERVVLSVSSCEHLYDVVPAALLKIFRGVKWAAVVHWVEDPPWTNTRGNTPALRRYVYHYSRRLAWKIIGRFADRVLAVSHITAAKLIDRHLVPASKVASVACGVNYDRIQDAVCERPTKRYAAVFLKRLNHGKGVFDLARIVATVAKSKPDVRLLVLGDGPGDVVAAFEAEIARLGVSRNIHVAGAIYDEMDKYRALLSAETFILPSYEENWAIVIGEALAAGLPVIAYGLSEIVPVWKEHVRWVPTGDVRCFAETLLDVLARIESFDPAPQKAFMRSFDWAEIAKADVAAVA